MRAKLEHCICIQGCLGVAKQHQYTRFGACTSCSEEVYPLLMWDKVKVWHEACVGHTMASIWAFLEFDGSLIFSLSGWKDRLVLPIIKLVKRLAVLLRYSFIPQSTLILLHKEGLTDFVACRKSQGNFTTVIKSPIHTVRAGVLLNI